MSFVGRQRELELLESAYRSDSSELIPVYGRRRVGKTELILQFLKEKPAVYFLGQQAPAGQQLHEFMESAGTSLQMPLFAITQAESWKKALETVVDQWPAKRTKRVVVLDEFQWMAQASPELPSVLQGLWDLNWLRRGNVMLILCGSFIGFMEREVLGRKSPLFGRRTAQIQLDPFGYREAGDFFPSWSAVDRAKAWFLCGGMPYYLRCFAQRSSIATNIRQQLLDPMSPLYREPDFLLREELREVENYRGILVALASGSLTAPELTRRTGISDRSLHYYLDQLISLRFVAKRYPITPGKRPRRVRFCLEDPLLRFLFGLVRPQESILARLGPEAFFDQLLQPQLESYFGLCFERLCREALPRLYTQEGVTAGCEVGEYWDKRVQIDVVGVRHDERIDLGECKWGRTGSLAQLANQLRHKATLFPNPENHTVQLRIFTKQSRRPDPMPNDLRWHTLNELYDD